MDNAKIVSPTMLLVKGKNRDHRLIARADTDDYGEIVLISGSFSHLAPICCQSHGSGGL